MTNHDCTKLLHDFAVCKVCDFPDQAPSPKPSGRNDEKDARLASLEKENAELKHAYNYLDKLTSDLLKGIAERDKVISTLSAVVRKAIGRHSMILDAELVCELEDALAKAKMRGKE